MVTNNLFQKVFSRTTANAVQEFLHNKPYAEFLR